MLKLPAVVTRLNSVRFITQLPNTYEVLRERGDVSELSQLNNGFRVATYANYRPTATIGVWSDAGSRYETPQTNGVAGVFEGLIHSGSTKRSPTQLQAELAKLGAHLKSYTNRECSAFFVECLAADVEKVVEILADVLCNTEFKASRLEEQRAIALDRLENSEKDVRASVLDNLHRTAFQGTQMGMSPLGSTESLKALTLDALTDFVGDVYKPSRMVLTAVGGVDHGALSKLAEKHFGHLDNNYTRKVPLQVTAANRKGHEHMVPMGVRFSGGEFMYRDDNYPYMYGAFAVEGVPRGDLDYLAMLLANTYVGKWDRTYGSPLNAPSAHVQKVAASKEGIAFENFNISYDNTGLFGVYVVLKGDHVDDAFVPTRALQRAWKHLATGITEEEVDRAKNALKNNLFSGLESNTQVANHMALEVLASGKITPLYTLERKVHCLNAGAVREAVSRHVYDRDIAMAAIGKIEAFPPYFDLRYSMSWWRL